MRPLLEFDFYWSSELSAEYKNTLPSKVSINPEYVSAVLRKLVPEEHTIIWCGEQRYELAHTYDYVVKQLETVPYPLDIYMEREKLKNKAAAAFAKTLEIASGNAIVKE
jgi:hypothetical protein